MDLLWLATRWLFSSYSVEEAEVFATVVGHLAWPLVVLAIVLTFRRQIAEFISEVEEAGWGSGKVKRGNEISRALKREASDSKEPLDDEAAPSEEERVADSNPSVTGTATEDLPAADAVAAERRRLLRFYRRIAMDRLQSSKYNTNTTSARLGAEIVGNTYADLKQALRMVAFSEKNHSGTRGRFARFETNMDALDLPDDLAADIAEARSFAHQVTSGHTKVDGNGASDYIDAVESLISRLINWAVVEAK